MTLSEIFADFICEDRPLPPGAEALCKRSILDTVGAMVLGGRTPVVQRAARLLRAPGGATAVGVGPGLAARDAAFLNGLAGHELELDDTSSSNLGHPTAAVLPTVLALGEELGSSGAQVLRAFAIATEVECKLGRVCARALHRRGWHASSVTGVVGAAAGAARLLNLDRAAAVCALGLAASMASGVRENFGTSAKSVHIGKCAADGVLAALLAREGFTASPSALDGAEGYLYEYTGERFGPFGQDFADTLGRDYDVCSPGFAIKQYPSCSSTHRAVDAFADLVREHGFTAGEVERVEFGLSQSALRELVTPDPKTGDEAKFSIGFQAALLLLGIDNMPASYRPELIFRPDVQRIIHCVTMYNESRYDDLPVDMGVGPAFVRVSLTGGRVLERERIYPVGHLTDPIPDGALKEKFMKCALGPLGTERAQALYAALAGLGRAGCIRAVMALTI